MGFSGGRGRLSQASEPHAFVRGGCDQGWRPATRATQRPCQPWLRPRLTAMRQAGWPSRLGGGAGGSAQPTSSCPHALGFGEEASPLFVCIKRSRRAPGPHHTHTPSTRTLSCGMAISLMWGGEISRAGRRNLSCGVMVARITLQTAGSLGRGTAPQSSPAHAASPLPTPHEFMRKFELSREISQSFVRTRKILQDLKRRRRLDLHRAHMPQNAPLDPQPHPPAPAKPPAR